MSYCKDGHSGSFVKVAKQNAGSERSRQINRGIARWLIFVIRKRKASYGKASREFTGFTVMSDDNCVLITIGIHKALC